MKYQIPLIADPKPNTYKIAAPATLGSITKNNAALNSTINVNYSGFTAQAQTAFQYAVDIWESLIDSPIPIEIDASFSPLGTGILGSAGPNVFYRDFTNAPQANTWYPIVLANSKAGTDLNGGTAEISAQFSSNFSNWYYGTDGNNPSNQYDFVSVVLHEIGHGLGFIDFFDYSGGQGSWGLGSGFPSVYDRFVENGSGQSLINTSLFPNPSTALGSQLTSNNVFFDGPNADAANGGNPVSLYAPSTWSGGSSIAHLGEVFNNTPNALMTYSIGPGEAIHNPGPVTLGLLKDIGWQLANTNTPTITVAVSPTSVTENGTTNLVYTFTRTGDTSSALNNVNFSVGGTATFNNDYTQTGATSFSTTTGVVNFAAGSATTTVTLDPTGDTTVESNETAILTLTSGTGYTAGSPNNATGTINNDDFPTISINDVSTTEGNSGTKNLTFTVRLSAAFTSNVTVNYATADDTATSPSDYNALSGTLTITPGRITKTLIVKVKGDTVGEPNESFFVNLSAPTNATISDSQGVGTINNNDVAIVTNNVVDEDVSNLSFPELYDNYQPLQLNSNTNAFNVGDFASDMGVLAVQDNVL